MMIEDWIVVTGGVVAIIVIMTVAVLKLRRYRTQDS